MTAHPLMTILGIGLLLAGCATPSQQIETFARANALERSIIDTTLFRHIVYSRHQGGSTLVVFLEGDGTPWFTPTIVSLDPTPTNPLLLRLLVQINASATYVGRPCYLGLAQDRGCEPRLWTSARYADVIIESMILAIKNIMARNNYQNVILIGHSGGGALAMLIASRMIEHVRGVMTLAANLDIDTWATYHGYAPLAASRNPANLPAFPASLRQTHFIGAKDRIVPPSITRSGLRNQPHASIFAVDDVGHAEWERVRPQITSVLQRWLHENP